MERGTWALTPEQQPLPGACEKWLIMAHVVAPMHWTLVEVRWNARKIMFYDSFSARSGYADSIQDQVRRLIQFGHNELQWSFEESEFEWVGEQVCHIIMWR